MISVEEEVELSVRIRNGDTEALQELVKANLRFVVPVRQTNIKIRDYHFPI